MTELIWDGNYDKDGKMLDLPTASLPAGPSLAVTMKLSVLN